MQQPTTWLAYRAVFAVRGLHRYFFILSCWVASYFLIASNSSVILKRTEYLSLFTPSMNLNTMEEYLAALASKHHSGGGL
jgi:hypothetical protein